LTAQFDYAGATSEELSINKGDRLILLNSDDQQWWYVRNEATKAEGYIPRSYVLQVCTISYPTLAHMYILLAFACQQPAEIGGK
jgi:hypothetical protein